MYQLESWAKRHNLKCGMVTLTSAQTGYDDEEILLRFKDSWKKFGRTLAALKIQYLMLYEPHKSGVPHIHVMLFGDLTDDVIQRLENLWHTKYEMGEKTHDFTFTPGLRDNIKSLVNYLMKYLSKTIISDIRNDESLMRFHSLFFSCGLRMWSASRYLSYVMGRYRLIVMKIDSIWFGSKCLYDRMFNIKRHYKIQQIDGTKYKYDLLPFEIKKRVDRNIPLDIMTNWKVRQFFDYVDAVIGVCV